MDKILLTAFLSALAGFITAVLSIVKLVNEKESKTTEYRQAWTDSVRKALSELIALINTQAMQIFNLTIIHERFTNLLSSENIDAEFRQRGLDFNEAALKDHNTAIRETQMSLQAAYAYTRLHFKPNDLSFNRIEHKFDIVTTLLNELLKSDKEADKVSLKERINACAADITIYSRDILKGEWETVKRGEPAYQQTKKWSIGGSIIMLFILLSIGVHTGIAMWKDSLTKASINIPVSPKPSPESLTKQIVPESK